MKLASLSLTPSVTVIEPNGGQVLQVGQTTTISWTSTGATAHRVQYTLDGTTFTPIATGLPGDARSVAWTIDPAVVPAGQTAASVRVRVIAKNTDTGLEGSDLSDQTFTVQLAPPAPSAPSVKVTAPNGGETLRAGDTTTVTWTGAGATSQRVQYTLDGINFTAIATGLPGDARSAPWTIAASAVPAGQTQVQARVRVVARDDASGLTADDLSDQPFTIAAAAPAPTLPAIRVTYPNGGETFVAGSRVTITWTSANATSHRVRYTANGVDFTPIATGLPGDARAYDWDIPSGLVASGAPGLSLRVGVVGKNDAGQGDDVSDGLFVVTAPPAPLSLTVTAPAPGARFDVGQVAMIRWSSSGATGHRVQYSIDGGATYVPIVTGLGGDARGYDWTIPAIVPVGVASAAVLIRVIARNDAGQSVDDAIDAPITVRKLGVTVLAPNGGERVMVGTNLAVRWTSVGATSHRVLLAIDGGDFAPIATMLPGSARSFDYLLPDGILPAGKDQVSARVKVIARDDDPLSVEDQSDSSFTIVRALAPGPRVDRITPNSGPMVGGTQVTIDGDGFLTMLPNETRVRIGDLLCAEVSRSSTQLVVVTQYNGRAGAADVVVSNPGGGTTTIAGGFTFTPSPLAITAVTPSHGAVTGNMSVVITGANFSLRGVEPPEVFFGDRPAPARSGSPGDLTRLQVLTPAGVRGGAVDVKVVNHNGDTAVLAGGFTYDAIAAPTIAAIMPSSGSTNGGARITITGTGFVAPLKVTIDGQDAGGSRISATEAGATAPTHAAPGAVDVTLTNPDGQAVTVRGGFTYVKAAPPVIASITPDQGPVNGGNRIVIAGTGLDGDADVKLGTRRAFGTLDAAGSLEVTAPAGDAVGPVDVKVTNPDGQRAVKTGGYRYAAIPAPMLVSATPSSGPLAGGTSVTLKGASFVSGVKVTIGGKPPQVISFLPSDPTRIGIVTPAGSAPGKVDLVVINPDGQRATLRGGFEYLQASQAPIVLTPATSKTPAAVNAAEKLVLSYRDDALGSPVPAAITVFTTDRKTPPIRTSTATPVPGVVIDRAAQRIVVDVAGNGPWYAIAQYLPIATEVGGFVAVGPVQIPPAPPEATLDVRRGLATQTLTLDPVKPDGSKVPVSIGTFFLAFLHRASGQYAAARATGFASNLRLAVNPYSAELSAVASGAISGTDAVLIYQYRQLGGMAADRRLTNTPADFVRKPVALRTYVERFPQVTLEVRTGVIDYSGFTEDASRPTDGGFLPAGRFRAFLPSIAPGGTLDLQVATTDDGEPFDPASPAVARMPDFPVFQAIASFTRDGDDVYAISPFFHLSRTRFFGLLSADVAGGVIDPVAPFDPALISIGAGPLRDATRVGRVAGRKDPVSTFVCQHLAADAYTSHLFADDSSQSALTFVEAPAATGSMIVTKIGGPPGIPTDVSPTQFTRMFGQTAQGDGVYNYTFTRPATLNGARRDVITEGRFRVDLADNLVFVPPALSRLLVTIDGKLTDAIRLAGNRDHVLAFSLLPGGQIDKKGRLTGEKIVTVRVELTPDGGKTWRAPRRAFTAAGGDYLQALAPDELTADGGAATLRIVASNKDLSALNQNPPKDRRLTYTFFVRID